MCSSSIFLSVGVTVWFVEPIALSTNAVMSGESCYMTPSHLSMLHVMGS